MQQFEHIVKNVHTHTHTHTHTLIGTHTNAHMHIHTHTNLHAHSVSVFHIHTFSFWNCGMHTDSGMLADFDAAETQTDLVTLSVYKERQLTGQ